jgi:hypothetical protein
MSSTVPSIIDFGKFTFVGSPNTKFARAAGASTLARTPNPSSDAINIGVWNSLISHLPFCPKATDIIGIVLIGLSAEKTS